MSLAELFPVVVVLATVPFYRPFLLQTVQFVVAFLEESVEFSGDDQRVNIAVELAVSSALEAIEIQHYLCDFEIATFIRKDVCCLFKYASSQFLLRSAVLR